MIRTGPILALAAAVADDWIAGGAASGTAGPD
jgi:hypothetical protein